MRAPPTLAAVITCVGALSLPASPLFVTVRQADRLSTPFDLSAPSISADGRYIAFSSYARLVPSDTNDFSDIYVLDRPKNAVTLESPQGDGHAVHRDKVAPRISADGRFVAYEDVDERAPVDSMPIRVVVVRDRSDATTRIIQRATSMPNGPSRGAAISGNGRIVAFSSCATNLTDEVDANGTGEDVYTYDTSSGAIARVSLTTDGRQPVRGASFAPTISADGRYVAFTSTAALDSAETPPATSKPVANIYLRDTRENVTTRVSVCCRGGLPNGGSYDAAISGDGRYIAFVSEASNLAPRDDNGTSDVFLHDLETGVTSLISRSVSGASANGRSGHPAISANGGVIVFQSEASDMICGSRCDASSRDINLVSDVFMFETATRAMTILSSGRVRWMEPSAAPAIDGTGGLVAFSSRHPVDANDVGNDFDLFVRTLTR